jgi:hypothetical protein
MKTKSYLIVSIMMIFLMSIFLISQVSAVTDESYIPSLDEVKQGSDVLLPRSGTNGTAAWEYCNITNIYGPNHLVLLGSVAMIKSGFSFNYTLSGIYTKELGTYIVEGVCGDGYNIQSFAFKFPVTTTGGDSAISLWISLILLAVAIIFLIIAFVLDSEYVGFMSGIVFIVAGVYIMIYGFGNMADLYTRAVSMLFLAIGLLIFFVSAFYAYDDENSTGFKKILGLVEESPEYDETDQFQRKDGGDD